MKTIHTSQLLHRFSSLFLFLAAITSLVRWSYEIFREFRLYRSYCASLWSPPTFCFQTLYFSFRSFWSFAVSGCLDHIDSVTLGRRSSQPCHCQRIWFTINHFAVPARQWFRPSVFCRTSSYRHMVRVHSLIPNWVHIDDRTHLVKVFSAFWHVGSCDDIDLSEKMDYTWKSFSVRIALML